MLDGNNAMVRWITEHFEAIRRHIFFVSREQEVKYKPIIQKKNTHNDPSKLIREYSAQSLQTLLRMMRLQTLIFQRFAEEFAAVFLGSARYFFNSSNDS